MRNTLLAGAAVLTLCGLGPSGTAVAQTAVAQTAASQTAAPQTDATRTDAAPSTPQGQSAAPATGNGGGVGVGSGSATGPAGAITAGQPTAAGGPPNGAAPGGTDEAAQPATADQSTGSPEAGEMKPPHKRHHRAGGAWAHEPGTGQSGPASTKASNIDSANTKSAIAPHLPAPDVAQGSPPEAYLRAAQRALAKKNTGRAQQALEMAETRLLTRSTDPAQANQPAQDPAIQNVTRARKALASGNIQEAQAAIQSAIAGLGSGTSGTGGSETGMSQRSESQAPAAPGAAAEGSGMGASGMSGSPTGGSGTGTVIPRNTEGGTSARVTGTDGAAGVMGTHPQ